MANAGNYNWNWYSDFSNTEKPKKPKLESHFKFEQVSFQEFQDSHNLDTFFYDFAGILLTSYRAVYYEGPWIAGGFFTRALQGETANNFNGDVDVWFKSEEQRNEFVADLESDRFGLSAKRAENYSTNYSYSYIIPYKGKEYKVQLIIYKTFESIESLLSRFDLFSTMIGTDGVNVFYEKEKSLVTAKNKRLEYNWKAIEEREAQSSAVLVMRRYSKFIANGYSISGIELEKFIKLIKELDILNASNDYNLTGRGE